MALTPGDFSDIITFSRAGGATRVNDAGLVVGVDFSSTSNTIATGSKTFTLTADANVNRDWPVGSSVIAVSQAGAVGSMTGTVVSYMPSTQVLVLSIASVTGSGTSTNWRIGSLEFRRDFDPVTLAAKGGLVEGGATNLYTNSDSFANAFSNNNIASIVTGALGLGGSNNAVTATENTATGVHRLLLGVSFGTPVTGSIYSFTCYVKPNGRTKFGITVDLSNANFGNGAIFDTAALTATADTAINGVNGAQTLSARIFPVANGFFKVEVVAKAGSSGSSNLMVTFLNNLGQGSYTGDGVSGLILWGAQIELAGASTSYIPTTTVAVTRAADVMNIDSARFSQFYNPSQGTLVMELTPTVSSVIAVAGSINDGTVDNSIRIQRSAAGLAETPVTAGGVLQANPTLGALAANVTSKVAMRIKANDFAASVNGADAVTDASGSLPSVNRLSIGMNGASGQHFNGHIRKISYYPSTKTDAELKGLST